MPVRRERAAQCGVDCGRVCGARGHQGADAAVRAPVGRSPLEHDDCDHECVSVVNTFRRVRVVGLESKSKSCRFRTFLL